MLVIARPVSFGMVWLNDLLQEGVVLNGLIGFAVFLLLMLGIMYSGYRLLMLLRVEMESRLEVVVGSMWAGFVPLLVYMLFCGVTGLLIPMAAWLYVGVISLLLLGGLSLSRSSLASFPTIEKGWDNLLFVMALIPVGIVFVASFAPPSYFDEVAYTLYLPQQYIESNSLRYIEEYGPYSAFPIYDELISVFGLLLGFGHIIPHLFHFSFYVLLSLSALLLVRELGGGRLAQMATLVILLCMPTLLEIAPVVKNDILLAFYQIGMLYFFLKWYRTERPALLLLSGLCLGVSLGIKYTAIASSGVLVLLLFWLFFVKKRQKVKGMLIFLVPAALLALPPFVRNIYEVGNPLYPMMGGIFGGGKSYEMLPVQIQIFHQLFYELKGVSWAGSDSMMPLFRRIASNVGLLPYIAFFAFPFVARAGRLKGLSGNAVPVFMAVLFLLVLWVFFLSWEPRHFLVLQVLVVVFGSFMLQWAASKRSLLYWIVVALLVAHMAWGSKYAFTRYASLVWGTIKGSQQEFVEHQVAYGAVAQRLNEITPKNAIVATNVQPFYYLHRHAILLHPLNEYGHFQTVDSAKMFLSRLSELSVSYVAYRNTVNLEASLYDEKANDVQRFSRHLAMYVRELSRSGHLRFIEEVGGVKLYQVRP